MTNPPSHEENPAMAQFAVLIGIITVLGLIIFINNPGESRQLSTDYEPDVISNPEIDESAQVDNQPTLPLAMFDLENPNGWDSPEAVTIIGTFQNEVGCDRDDTIDCPETEMIYDILGDIWRTTLEIPAGTYSYHASLDAGKNIYGKNGIGGENSLPVELTLDSTESVNFYYDHKTGWITDDVNSLILTMPSNFQDEVGCIEEWNAGCFRTWMQDVDGDGIYTYETLLVPGGSWEARIAVNADIETSYGQGGEFNGDNYPLWTPNIGHLSVFTWDSNLNTFTPFVSQVPIRLESDLPEIAPNQQ